MHNKPGLGYFLTLLIPITLLLSSCNESAAPSNATPEWVQGRTIYEVNLRQYTGAGTFTAFAEHLPRLKELGVGILWFMPIHPIGKLNRKGSLGSYYSVQDYLKVNPEYGTLADFKALIQQAHALDMYVIIDWVANHTAWDNSLVKEHPEWYTRNEQGEMIPPVADWHDVADLNYDQPELRTWMTEAMKYWVTEADIDGFRCDVAEMVPDDFWRGAISELRSIKPVFMLAEGESPAMYAVGFDATYSWKIFKALNKVAEGEMSVSGLKQAIRDDFADYPAGALRMHFTTNHDENAWNGTAPQRLQYLQDAAIVVTFTLPGLPLIYSGQEAGLNHSLAFFDKDPIQWRYHPHTALFQRLTRLKRDQKALRGHLIQELPTPTDSPLLAFRRGTTPVEILVISNLGTEPVSYSCPDDAYAGIWIDRLTDQSVTWDVATPLSLDPGESRLLTHGQ